MARIQWHQANENRYETGVDQGVLYVVGESGYGTGVPWNGLVNVTEKPTGAETTDLYADNIKYAGITSAENFEASIEAFTYPDEFEACNGNSELVPGVTVGMQPRSSFGLAYRTLVGSAENASFGYKIHLVYGSTAGVSERAYGTVNDSPEAGTMSWDLKTTPVSVEGMKPTSILTIKSWEHTPQKMAAFEAVLYGDSAAARLPLPAEVKTLLTV